MAIFGSRLHEAAFRHPKQIQDRRSESPLRPSRGGDKAYQDQLEELQTDNSDRLVRDKLLKAFRRVKRALIVEHITSSRANCARGKVAITQWLKENKVPFDKVSTRVGAALYIDDLAVRFDGKWSVAAVEEWLKMESWHKHPHSKMGP